MVSYTILIPVFNNVTVGVLGVVNSHLKVYDTSNVRVVDASVVPLHVSAHLAASLYGVAEKAADLIKASYRENCGACLASEQALFNVQ